MENFIWVEVSESTYYHKYFTLKSPKDITGVSQKGTKVTYENNIPILKKVPYKGINYLRKRKNYYRYYIGDLKC